jgi:hypothetical protein
MISGVVAPLQTLFDMWGLMMEMAGKIECPLCYDELSLRMLGFLGFELKVTLGGLSRIWKAYQFRGVYGAHFESFRVGLCGLF